MFSQSTALRAEQVKTENMQVWHVLLLQWLIVVSPCQGHWVLLSGPVRLGFKLVEVSVSVARLNDPANTPLLIPSSFCPHDLSKSI